LWIFSIPVQGQTLFALKRKQNVLSFTTGIYKIGPVFSGGYARGIHLKIFKLIDEDITLFLDLASKTNFQSENEFKFTYGGQAPILKKNNFKILFRKTFTVTRLNTESYDATYLGGELQLMAGIYNKKYFTAFHIYYGDSFKGHVVKDRDLKNVFGNIKTGWVNPRSGIVKLGFNAGRYIKENICLFVNTDFFLIRPRHSISRFPFSSAYVGLNYLF